MKQITVILEAKPIHFNHGYSSAYLNMSKQSILAGTDKSFQLQQNSQEWKFNAGNRRQRCFRILKRLQSQTNDQLSLPLRIGLVLGCWLERRTTRFQVICTHDDGQHDQLHLPMANQAAS